MRNEWNQQYFALNHQPSRRLLWLLLKKPGLTESCRKEGFFRPPRFDGDERFFFACFVVSTLSLASSASAFETVGLATSWLTLFCLPFLDISVSPFM
ncbi:hypothetical protein [Geobacillus sp. YF-1]|uniref:hypothetical protein n=1 Tax=Geobacillus sp. YF-1 TaxID=3457480 RepID=UPI00404576E0